MRRTREVATCVRCKKVFTRIRVNYMIKFQIKCDGHAPDMCPRCLMNIEIAGRRAAVEAARERWERTIRANERALEKCMSGQCKFVDKRGQ